MGLVRGLPSGDEASREMGQSSLADLLALDATSPHRARAMTGAQRGAQTSAELMHNLVLPFVHDVLTYN